MNGSDSSEPTGSDTGLRPKALPVGPITHDAKQTGERRTGNPFAPSDEAGAGNGLLRAPRQSSTLPVADSCSPMVPPIWSMSAARLGLAIRGTQDPCAGQRFCARPEAPP